MKAFASLGHPIIYISLSCLSISFASESTLSAEDSTQVRNTLQERRQVIESADVFASKLKPKSDREYLKAFRRAAIVAETGTTLAPADKVSAALPAANSATTSRSILSNDRFAKNQRTLVDLRVLGAVDVADASFQNCVAVGREHEYFCTGTLIADDLVITARHCALGGSPDSVLFGNDVSDTAGRREVKVMHVEASPDPGCDLLLLKLEEKVAGITPAQIASSQIPSGFPDNQPSLDFQIIQIVGFGTTNRQGTEGFGHKRFAYVPVAGDDPTLFQYKAGLEFAAGKPHLGIDTCRGDSGGPAFINIIGLSEPLLLGCTSRATPAPPGMPAENICGDGGVYVRVDKQLSWIRDVATKMGSALRN
jgi:endonuclease G, mitochondrial